MSDPAARTFGSDFRRFFLRGLVILLPTVLTLWIVVKAYQFVDGAIAEPINGGVRVMIANVTPYWRPLREEFDPAKEQLDATVAERAVARGLVTREVVRAELRQQSLNDPTDVQVNAAIAARDTVQKAINAEVIRTDMRSAAIQAWWAAHWYMNLIGLIIAIVAVYITGYLLGGLLGKGLYKYVERIIVSLPIFKQVYPYVKQIVDFLFSDEKAIKFNRVVLVQYPRAGIWSIGFQTGGTMRVIAEQAGDAVTIFIPSSPTPFTGYTITVPRSEIIELPITVEEAIRFVVSGGVLLPDRQRIPALATGETIIVSETTTVALVTENGTETAPPSAPRPVVGVRQPTAPQ